jgi:hypothetical protein
VKAGVAAVCIFAGFAGCAVTTQEPGEFVLEFSEQVLGEIEVLVINPAGDPIDQVALFVEGNVYPVLEGGVVLSVTGPVTMTAYKPGYGPSHPQIMLPGQRVIVLYPTTKAN